MFTPTADKLMPDLTPREELVVLARALWREGYNDHLAGHITVNLGDGTLLCNPWLLTWAELRPSQVLRIDLEGRVVEGDWPVPLGIPLHLELHKARHDVGWAVHNHPLFGTVWADLAELPPILDQSSALGGGTLALVDEYEGPVNDPAAPGAPSSRWATPRWRSWLGTASSCSAARRARCTSAPWHSSNAASTPGTPGRPAGRRVAGPATFIDLVSRGNGEGFLGFWEAAVRAELAATRICSTDGQKDVRPWAVCPGVSDWGCEPVVVHAPHRRLHLVHGARSRIALDRGRRRLAGRGPRLGGPGAIEWSGRLPGASSASVRSRCPFACPLHGGPRIRTSTWPGICAGSTPRTARPRRGPRAGGAGSYERLRPHASAVGVHSGRRSGGRPGGSDHEDASFADRRDRRRAARARRSSTRSAEGGAGGPLPAAPPGEHIAGHRLVLQALADRADVAVRPRGRSQAAPGALARVARHPFGAGADVVETARSIGRTVQPLPATLSPVMTERGPGRVLHSITVGLDELKQAGAQRGDTQRQLSRCGHRWPAPLPRKARGDSRGADRDGPHQHSQAR